MAEPIGEETISTIVEDTAINTEENDIVIYDSVFSQGDGEYPATTSAFNFDEFGRPELTEGAITKNNSIPRQLNLSMMFELKHIFEKGSQ